MFSDKPNKDNVLPTNDTTANKQEPTKTINYNNPLTILELKTALKAKKRYSYRTRSN